MAPEETIQIATRETRAKAYESGYATALKDLEKALKALKGERNEAYRVAYDRIGLWARAARANLYLMTKQRREGGKSVYEQQGEESASTPP